MTTTIGAPLGVVASQIKPTPVFNPLSIPWRHAFWANDPGWAPPADGGSVTTWRDAGTAPADLTWTNQRPIYRATVTGLKNKRAVQFDGNQQAMNQATTSFTTPYTAVVVVIASDVTGDRTFIGRLTGGGLMVVGRSGVVNMYAGNFQTSPVPFVVNTPMIVYATVTVGTTDSLRVNGTTTGSLNAGDSAFAGITLGWDGGSAKLPGHIPFAAIYPGIMTAQEMTDLDAWAKTYYGVPIP